MTRVLLCVLSSLSTTLALTACGDDSTRVEPPGTGPGAGDASSMHGGDAGALGTNSESTRATCTFPPHARGRGTPASGCQFACEEGFADCDGEIANGCEIVLADSDACAACPAMAAMRCLQPSLCGLAAPACTPFDGNVWTSQGQIVDSQISSLAVAPDSERVFAVTSREFDSTKATDPSPGATLFDVRMVPDGGLVWVAPGSGAFGRVYTHGERLYLHSGNPADLSEMSVGVFSFDGKLIWKHSIADSENARQGGGLAVDEAGNVYVTGHHAAAGGLMLVALDATGAERWRSSVRNATSVRCRGLEDGALHDLRFSGGKLFGITDGCLVELDTMDGSVVREQPLRVRAYDARLRNDAAGNLYVADQASPGPVLPIASLLKEGWSERQGFPVNATSIYVSKYGPELEHLWTRSFASTGPFSSDAPSNPTLRGFEMNSAGVGYLLGVADFPFLVQIDSEGRSVAATVIENSLYPAHQLAVGENGTPFLAGTFKTTLKELGIGMFIWNPIFSEGGPVTRSADAGTSRGDAGGATASDAGRSGDTEAASDAASTSNASAAADGAAQLAYVTNEREELMARGVPVVMPQDLAQGLGAQVTVEPRPWQ